MNDELTLAVVRRFNEATARHDIDEMMVAMTDDCLFDNTSPAPDGEAFRGQSAVGVDVFRVRDGKIAEKRAYVKG